MTDRAPPNTYFSHAQADADLAGGRFARIEATRVTGVPAVPALPPLSPWSRDPVPPEQPLGQDVNAMEPVGTAPEIERSIHALGGPALAAPVAASPAVTVETERGPLNPSTIRRR